MTINFERAVTLLTVIEKCAANPSFSSIGGEAGIELTAMNKIAIAHANERAAKAKADKVAADFQAQQEADHRAAADLPRVIPAKSIPIFPEPDEELTHVERRI